MNIFSSFFQRLLSLPRWFVTRSILVKIICVGIVIALAVGGWQLTERKSTAPTYQTSAVEKGTLVVSVTASGQVSSTNNASVTAAASGVVKRVYVKNGQTVRSGQILAELDLDQSSLQKYNQARASYQSAKNALAAAESSQLSLQSEMFSQWNSYKTLAESDTYKDTASANRSVAEFHIAKNDWLAAEAKYKTQSEVIAQSRTALSSAWMSLQQSSPQILAPISGTVSGMSLQIGSVIAAGSSSSSSSSTTSEKIANIHTDANPQVTVNLTEVDVVNVKIGNKVTLTFDALPNKTYTGEVASVDTAGSVSSGVTTYPTVICLDSAAEGLLPNMSASASIITQVKDNALIVPSSAVQTANGQATLQLMKDGKPQTVQVETGITSGTQTEIANGVVEGDIVVTRTISATSATATTTSPFSAINGARGGTRTFSGGAGAVMIGR